MTRLRSYAPIAKPSRPDAAFQKVYAQVDQRSEGRCEVVLDGEQCKKAAVEHHHTIKPRASHHAPELVIHICRGHHDRCEWPYKRGRLVIVAHGGAFFCGIVTAPDKFTYRQTAPTTRGTEREG